MTLDNLFPWSTTFDSICRMSLMPNGGTFAVTCQFLPLYLAFLHWCSIRWGHIIDWSQWEFQLFGLCFLWHTCHIFMELGMYLPITAPVISDPSKVPVPYNHLFYMLICSIIFILTIASINFLLVKVHLSLLVWVSISIIIIIFSFRLPVITTLLDAYKHIMWMYQ